MKTDQFIKKLKNVINTEDLEKQILIVERLIQEDYTSLETAAALMKMAMTEENTDDESDNGFGNTGASPGMVRFFLNIGRKDRIKAKDIVRAVGDKTGLSSSIIGKVDVYDKFSFMEIPNNSAKDVYSMMKGVKIKGRTINIEPANKRMK